MLSSCRTVVFASSGPKSCSMELKFWLGSSSRRRWLSWWPRLFFLPYWGGGGGAFCVLLFLRGEGEGCGRLAGPVSFFDVLGGGGFWREAKRSTGSNILGKPSLRQTYMSTCGRPFTSNNCPRSILEVVPYPWPLQGAAQTKGTKGGTREAT